MSIKIHAFAKNRHYRQNSSRNFYIPKKVLKIFLTFFQKGLAKCKTMCYNSRVHRGIAQLVEYWSPKPRVVGSSPSAPAKSLGRFRSDREKTRKAEISRDFSAFFAPNFFRISIDPFSIFLRVEGFELPKMLFFKN